MFFPSDPITEIVAHFVGYFQIAVEDMRIRLGYEQIEAELAAEQIDPTLDQLSADIAQTFELGAYQPGVAYLPPSWTIEGHAPVEQLAAQVAIPIVVPELPVQDHPPLQPHAPEEAEAPLIGPEPGSVIAIITQSIGLSDDDIVVMGDYEGPVTFDSGADAGVTLVHDAAASISAPVTQISAINSVVDVPILVEEIAEIYAELAQSEAPPEQMTVNAVETLDGTYVNGESVAEAPDMVAALPEQWRELIEEGDEDADEAVTGTTVQITISGSELEGSVTLETGGNLLVNEASVFNGGLTSAVFAVDGDLHQLDVIIQTNAHFDVDSLDPGTPGAAANNAGSTTTYNAASFVQEVLDATGDAAAANPGVMPTNWSISVVTGDVIFIEWMTQFTFSSDQDISVLSSTGSNTLITSGENIALNTVSFADIGLYYDLIIVGGDLYDANIIVQTNVLYDNDTIALLSEGSLGGGSLSTSGNALFNQASIHNVGPTTYVEDVPDHYEEAMDRLEDGRKSMPDGFETDAQFEGFHMLRVLYIAGDVYDLRYIEQTNILGDADYVAIQKANLLEDHPEIEWDISTGSNALVNVAAIKDYDGMGDTAYVDGEVYSDAILIQADILAHDADDQGGDALVTEVIAFLDVDVDDIDDGGIGPIPPSADGPPADIIQSVLA